MSNETVIIDCNYVGHASRFSIDNKLATSTGIKTNVIFGFLQTVINLGINFNTSNLVFVWDSKKSKRKELFPEYKKSRHKDLTKEEKEELNSAFRQFNILHKKVLPGMGFENNFLLDGYEGDDLIASIIKSNPRVNKFLIYASDHDLYQLLDSDVSIFQKRKLYTVKSFIEEFGINPSQWSLVKSLAGCSSDEVPGIKGVGEVTACKYLRNELKPESKAFQKIKEQEESVKQRNIPLVQLPFEGTPEIKLVKNSFDIKKTKELFRYFEFKQFLEEFDDWKELLNNENS